jgi:5-formyltetrahydrofolate cyclo-ligase
VGLHALGRRICVPVIQGAGLPLRFREWVPGCALEAGPFGAEVPVAGEWLEPDVLLVPLLAFDARLYRLGYGGGYYDRTLAKFRGERQVIAAGFAFAGQRVHAVPVDEFDQRLDAVITEDGIFRG